jgi:hypothetical protein
MIFLILEVKDLFKQELGYGPIELQETNAYMLIPWSFKLIFGLISDSFPICGYKRKVYLIINGLIGVISLQFIVPDFLRDRTIITMLLCLSMTCTAFNDVI